MKKGLSDLKALAEASALAFPSSIADSLAPIAGKNQDRNQG